LSGRFKRFGGFEAGGLRRDGVLAVGEENFRRDFRNGFDHAHAVLRMADVHADVQGFDFHAGNLTTACRAEASSEGGMDADAHGFFKTYKSSSFSFSASNNSWLTTPQNALGSEPSNVRQIIRPL
jgi:hypothetical protein